MRIPFWAWRMREIAVTHSPADEFVILWPPNLKEFTISQFNMELPNAYATHNIGE
jgi:hypothetical protein